MASLEKKEKEALYENDSNEVPPSDIVAFNELRSCADLYRMFKEGILKVDPDFQRDFVWQGPDQTRFVDSLIKQLPIPSLCFAMDYKQQRWMVIDGLQRISTIVRFLEGGNWKLSKLDDIDPAIAGKSVAAIKTAKDSLKKYYTRIENQTLPINVLRCDFDKKNHLEYLFTIFHRLNAGGMKLNNQEIRNCIYGGDLNALLRLLDEYPPWRSLNHMKPKDRARFVKQELILRFFAFLDRRSQYTGHVAKFLNDYMHDHRNATGNFLEAKRKIFNRVVDAIVTKIFRDEMPKKMPVTILEAILVAVATNIDAVEGMTPAQAAARYKKVINHPDFSDTALAEGLAKKPKVNERMKTAIDLFAS